MRLISTSGLWTRRAR